MQHVCVLISKPGAAAITKDLIESLHTHLRWPGMGRWLCPREAYEMEVENLPVSRLDEARDHLLREIRDLVGDRPVDAALIPVDHRHKHLLIADMDSTMIEQECIDELADALGLKPQVAAITERAMRGEIEFAPAVRERVALLKGLARAEIERIADDRITITPGAQVLVRTMRAAGAYTALVSGGFTLFTARVAKAIGFHMNHANELNFDGDVLDGTVAEPILGQEAKRETLRDLLRGHALMREQALAVGDGANDLAMIDLAGTGVAFRAKPAVAEAADVRIDHGDLTALLYLQGFTRAEFAA